MEYVVVKVNANWADEVDLEGIKIMPLEEWNRWQETLMKYFEHDGIMDLPAGSNQSIEIESFSQWESCVWAQTRVTEEERDVLVRALGSDSLGFVWPLYTDFLDTDLLEELGFWD